METTAVLTHPSDAPTNDGDIIALKSFIYSVPDQAAPNHGSAECRIVGYLGKPSSVDKDSLR